MSELQLSEAVPLAHALVAWVAAEVDVRVLFIKGPAAVEQGLRAPRQSVDVDAWVDPGRRPVLVARLAELGWVDEHPYTSPTVLPQHSLTLRNPRWACEVDLHDRFPGFFADPQEVFEQLWRRHDSVPVAGRLVGCPDPAGHALILALHALRDPHHPGHDLELAALVHRVRESATDDSLRDLAELAVTLGAADTAAPFLDAVGVPTLGRGSTAAADLRAWQLRTRPQASIAGWLGGVRDVPLRKVPAYLWYAVWLSEQELRLDDPNLPAGRAAVRRARLRRLRRGMQGAPAALRSLWADRRASHGGR